MRLTMDEQRIARRALIRVQPWRAKPEDAFRIEMLTAWHEYNRRLVELWMQDIRQNTALYSPHIDRATAFYSQIPELWQGMLSDDMPENWTETAAGDLLFWLLKAIFRPRKPPELQPLKVAADNEIEKHREGILSLNLTKVTPPASPAEIAFVPLIPDSYDGLARYFAGSDPLVFAVARRVHQIAVRVNQRMEIVPFTKREYYWQGMRP